MGPALALFAQAGSPDGIAGQFANTGLGGKILSGLDSNLDEVFEVAGNGDVSLTGTLTASTVIETSSARLKEDVRPLDGALDKVSQLQGVSFRWKTDGRRDIGLIAEDVAQVLPELVRMEADGRNVRGLDYSHLSAVLIEAVKEQQAMIMELKAELQEVRTQIDGAL